MLALDTYLGLLDLMKHLIGCVSSVNFLRHVSENSEKKYSPFTLTYETEITGNKLFLIFLVGKIIFGYSYLGPGL